MGINIPIINTLGSNHIHMEMVFSLYFGEHLLRKHTNHTRTAVNGVEWVVDNLTANPSETIPHFKTADRAFLTVIESSAGKATPPFIQPFHSSKGGCLTTDDNYFILG